MNIIQDEMSKSALRYKQIAGNSDQKSRSEMNKIFRQIRKQFEGVLKNKQKSLPLGDQNIIESHFDDSILYALTKWKGTSPFGGYLAVCFKGIIRNYCKEISPVNRNGYTKRVSYDLIVEKLYEFEDNVDVDDAGFLCEDDELRFAGELIDENRVDYTDFDDEYERLKLD